MRVRWFGAERWSNELCDLDYQIDAPVGTKCLECTKPVKLNDRGVVTACSPRIWGSWTLPVGDGSASVCSYHLACFLTVVSGGVIEGTPVADRMHGAVVIKGQSLPPEITEKFMPDEGEEEATPGKGWGRVSE